MTSPSTRITRTFALLAAIASTAAWADPLPVRNQNPLLAPYGLPGPLPARLPEPGQWRAGVMTNVANAADTERASDLSYTLDAEALEFRLHVERGLGSRLALRAELPWRQVSAGSLDSVVENWHDIFGFADGPRAVLPRDELLIEFTVDNTTLLGIDRSRSGVADIPLSLGYALLADETRALSMWLGVKLPTGAAADLTGSGAVDVSLSLAGETALAERWKLFGQLDAVRLGEGDLLPSLQKDFAWSALAGLSWNAWRRLTLTAQVAANSAVFAGSGTNLAGDAVLMSFAGSYVTANGWQVVVGFSEDVEVRASPDVAFHLGLSRAF